MSNDLVYQNLSELSQKELHYISETDMESAYVAKYFNSGLRKRTFQDVLRSFMPGKNDDEIKGVLKTRFCEYEPDLKPDSVRKNIDNWFNGKEPDDKKTLVKICFALSLSEDDARRFMKFTQESDFHIRNPEDAAFLYCLRAGKSYKEAESFVQNYPMPPMSANHDDRAVYTDVVADALRDVSTDEEFKRFYRENLDKFGRLRNTAYDKFKRFMKVLGEPEGRETEEAFTIDEIVDTYLRMKLPLNRKTSQYDAVRKSIRAYWPNRTDVEDIYNRAEHSDRKIRKILLLLYVVTEGFVELNLGKEDRYESDEMFQGLFMEHVVRLNLMMHQCGLALLDPRNPFDWLILYCLKTDDDEGEGMSGQLQEVLSILFPQPEM
jgi:hypothetical protein